MWGIGCDPICSSLQYCNGHRLAGMGIRTSWSPAICTMDHFFGLAWLFAIWQRWQWFSYIGLTFNFLAAILGLWVLNFPPGWMFAGAIGGLFAWDLTYFRYRQRFVPLDEEQRALQERHLTRISFLALLGFGFANAAMLLKFQFNFEWGLLSAVVAALGFTQLVSWFRKRDL